MAKDCTNTDELMMDFLYQELAAEDETAFRKHVDSCERCTGELARFQGVRSAARMLTETDPPVAVSARLMSEAAEAVKPSAAKRAWVWLVAVFEPMRAHPAMAAAAALVVVVGVGGLLMRRGYRGDQAEKSVAFDDRESAQGAAPAAATPPAGAVSVPEFELRTELSNSQLEAQAEGDQTTEGAAAIGAADDEGRYARMRKDMPADKQADPHSRSAAGGSPPAERAQNSKNSGPAAGETMARPKSADGDDDMNADGVLAEAEAPTFADSTPSAPGAKEAKAPAKLPASKPTASPDGFSKPPPPMAPSPEPTTAGRGGGGTGSTSTTGSASPSGGDFRQTPSTPPVVTAPSPATPSDSGIKAGGKTTSKTTTKKETVAPNKPMTAQQLQTLADSRRRQGNCMGALYLYDEILRKYPTYPARKTVASSRDKCVADLTGKANRNKAGSSAGSSKAKAAPVRDDAAESVKLSGE